VDARFAEFVAHLNALGLHPPLRAPTALDRGAYGWCEFVGHAPCDDAAGLTRYYQRFGATLALLHALHATDAHFENLIAAGEHPVLVDLEALFHPAFVATRADQPAGAPAGVHAGALRALVDSVLRTGLLPTRAFAADDFAGAEVSALGGAAGQTATTRALVVVDGGTDAMRVVRASTPLPPARNRPAVAGAGTAADPARYMDAIDDGFVSAYRLLARNKDALAAPGGLLDAFRDVATRAVLRATHTYSTLLLESYHPNHLRDALDREQFFDHLWAASAGRPALLRLVRGEVAELMRGDVPLFTTRPSSRDAWTGAGEHLPDLFDTSGLDLARQRVRALGERDLQLQRWVLGASLVALPAAPAPADAARATATAATPTAATPTPRPTPAHTPATRTSLVAAARDVARRLLNDAIPDADGPGWLGVGMQGPNAWGVQPLGDGLYDGRLGVALFLAHHGALAGDPAAVGTARAVVAAVARALDALTPDEVADAAGRGTAVSGGFGAVGGAAYALLHCGVLWRDAALVDVAERLLLLVRPTLDQDEHLDVTSGAAGAALLAATAYRATNRAPLLDVVRAAADRLVDSAFPIDGGVAWTGRVAATRPLVGFSHGASGMATALLQAAALLGRPDYRALALRAFDYERRQFTHLGGGRRAPRLPRGADRRAWRAGLPHPAARPGNWPDYRILDERATAHAAPTRDVAGRQHPAPVEMLAWCHGAPGVGLAPRARARRGRCGRRPVRPTGPVGRGARHRPGRRGAAARPRPRPRGDRAVRRRRADPLPVSRRTGQPRATPRRLAPPRPRGPPGRRTPPRHRRPTRRGAARVAVRCPVRRGHARADDGPRRRWLRDAPASPHPSESPRSCCLRLPTPTRLVRRRPWRPASGAPATHAAPPRGTVDGDRPAHPRSAGPRRPARPRSAPLARGRPAALAPRARPPPAQSGRLRTACLAMVLSYHGRHTTVAEATHMTGTGGRDGTSLEAMARAAESCGLRAVRTDAAAMTAQPPAAGLTPAIVHWRGRHFVVAERVTRRGVRVVDPATGRAHVDTDAFADAAGAVLALVPTSALVPVPRPLVAPGTRRVYTAVRRAVTARGGFAQLLAASLLLQLLGLALPAATAVVVDHAVPTRSTSVLAAAAALAAGVAGGTAVSTFVRALVLARVHLRVDARLTAAVVEHLVRLPVPYLAARSAGDLVQRVTGTAALRDLVSSQLLTLCLDGPTAVVYLAVLAAASPWMAAATLAAAALQVAVLTLGAGRLRELAAGSLATRAAEQAALTETLRHVVGLKACGAEASAVARWRSAFAAQQRAGADRNVLGAGVDAALSVGRTGAPFLLLLVAAWLTLRGTVSLGTALALSALAAAGARPRRRARSRRPAAPRARRSRRTPRRRARHPGRTATVAPRAPPTRYRPRRNRGPPPHVHLPGRESRSARRRVTPRRGRRTRRGRRRLGLGQEHAPRARARLVPAGRGRRADRRPPGAHVRPRRAPRAVRRGDAGRLGARRLGARERRPARPRRPRRRRLARPAPRRTRHRRRRLADA
jgi:type 2 lantibiotic biosynthesis protein LanM